MYEYLTGKATILSADALAIDAGGVGYRVSVTPRTAGNIQDGDAVRLYIHMQAYSQVNDISFVLFGFPTREEREMFERLLSVSGIGPKVAMAVLSRLSVNELAIAIMAEDAAALSKINGIGAKTAQRIILELKGKVQGKDAAGSAFTTAEQEKGGILQEAIAALTALGYAPSEAARAVSSAKEGAKTVEELILKALKGMNDRR